MNDRELIRIYFFDMFLIQVPFLKWPTMMHKVLAQDFRLMKVLLVSARF